MDVRVAVLFMIHILVLAAPPGTNCERRRGFRTTMIRREKAINLTRAARQSYERLSMLAARLEGGASTQTPLRWDGAGAYDMELSMGTPPQKLSALADTGSDLVWAKCGPCASCTPRGSPSYDPTKSSSFSKLPCPDPLCRDLKNLANCSSDPSGGSECDYRYSYGLSADQHYYTQGYMGRETFTLGAGDAAQGVGFGCTNMSEGNYGTGSGLVGLGRGNLSLVSQLGAGAFSYCLVQDPSKASPLLFGSMAPTLTGADVQSTRLLDAHDTHYTVNLKSISIGSATTPGTNAGVVFDSGTTLTYLAEPAYTAAKAAVLAQTSLPPVDVGGDSQFEACFQGSVKDVSSGAGPIMVLHFDGPADMELPAENYFVEVQIGVICWVVQSSPSLSLIGNIMQMNYHIRHDLQNKVLSFKPTNCSSL